MPRTIDAAMSEDGFKDILFNCEYIKSMGLRNDIGSRAIIDNEVIDKYISGEASDK